MYKIYCDDTLIYDSTLDDYVITKGQVSKELNKSGSFVFTIYSDNPFYNTIQKMKSIIRVLKGDELIFRGRVIQEAIGFHKDKTFTCEGELGFLLDSIMRPFEFTGTPENLFRLLIDVHNNQVDEFKRFKVGTITVTDANNYINRSSVNYESVSSNLLELVDSLGGYIFITENSSGERVINWYADSPYRSDQAIELGENLLDFTKNNKAEDIVTALIPLGAEITDEATGIKTKLTIESVNNGVDYVYDSNAVNTYGWIYSTETWSDVTVASNLKSKAEAYLSNKIKQSITIELTAIDLSLIDKDIDSFELGDYIRIVSAPHSLDDDYLLEKQTIDLLKPDNDKITLGYAYTSFSDQAVANDNKNNTLIKKVEVIESNYVVNEVVASEVERLSSLINQTSSEITAQVSRDYATKDGLTSEISTVYKQLKDEFSFNFSSLEEKVNDNDASNRSQFQEIQKYIRFVDGNIILGETGNELELEIKKDRISFYQGGEEVAYFSNNKLYVTDGEFLVGLKIGNFEFIPRANGNLSFKKVGG